MTLFWQYLFFGFTLLSSLLALSCIDIKTFRLPNALTYSLIVIGIGTSFALPHITPKAALIGAIIGYLSLVLVEQVFKGLTKKEGLGRGDAKLFAAAGAWCGWFGLPYIILIASLCGLMFTQIPSQKSKIQRGETHIAFGPFLALGIFMIWCGQIYFGFK